MEERLFIALLGMASAFGLVYAVVLALARALKSRRAALMAAGLGFTPRELVLWRIRNGYAATLPVAHAFLKLAWVEENAGDAVRALDARGYTCTAETLLSVFAATLAALGVVVGTATRSIVGAIAVCACMVAVAFVLVGSARDKRRDEVRESAPAALESMGACFGAGLTLLQTFRQVADDVPGYLGTLFARSAHVLETGGTAEQALSVLRDGTHASELAFVAVALDVQHQAGGSMKQVLDAAGDSVKGELALRRSLRVQTAQAKLSARIVVVMPFLLVAVFSIVSPDFLSPFFSSAFGYALLGLAVAMQVAGVVLVHRALSVEGVS